MSHIINKGKIQIFFSSFVIYNCLFFCFSIDAEGVSNSICHFVNDADKTANSVMKLKVFHEKEYLCLYAMKDIQPGEEIQYNYGDKENLWWRSKVKYIN